MNLNSTLPTRIAAGISLVFAFPLASNADPVTYDFTGTVGQGTGIYSGAGTTVSGSITIDIGAAANPQQNFGAIGSATSTWAAQAYGGSMYNGVPSPSSQVFTESLSTGTLDLIGGLILPVNNDTFVEGVVNPTGLTYILGDFAIPA